jgi:hypothetical protein
VPIPKGAWVYGQGQGHGRGQDQWLELESWRRESPYRRVCWGGEDGPHGCDHRVFFSLWFAMGVFWLTSAYERASED